MSSSRARKRARKRVWNGETLAARQGDLTGRKTWAEKRAIIARNEREELARESARKATKPDWVAKVESSGSQTIGGTRRSARVSGLTRQERKMNRDIRQSRGVKQVSDNHRRVRQVRADGRAEIMPNRKRLSSPVNAVRVHQYDTANAVVTPMAKN